jgi:hypothetical protein
MYRIVQGRVMRIDLRTNFPSVASRVAAIGQQGPFALAVSMTRSAKDAQAAMRAEEQRVFDKPTAYALNGNYIKPATKQHLVAELGVKSKSDSKGAPLERVLGPEIYGGGRFQKGFERMLTRAGVLPAGWRYLPLPHGWTATATCGAPSSSRCWPGWMCRAARAKGDCQASVAPAAKA